MEKQFNTDNFEALLREATDDFRMYPAKRVWHGIYNDLHPAKKWPSFAVLLLLITSIMYIGVANPDKSGQGVEVVSVEPTSEAMPTVAGNARGISGTGTPDLTETDNRTTGSVTPSNLKFSSSSPDQQQSNNLYIASLQKDAVVTRSSNASPSTMTLVNDELATNNNQNNVGVSNRSEPVGAVARQINNAYEQQVNNDGQSFRVNNTPLISASDKTQNSLQLQTTNSSTAKVPAVASASKKVTKVDMISGVDESGWMEDYALRNLKSKDKWKGRMAYQVYVTPSIGYRILSKNIDYSLPQTNALVVNPYAPASTNYALNHSSAINLEIGGGIIYSASKLIRLKAGVQLNYTNYSINAQELNHPTFTALMLNNTLTNTRVLSTRTTNLANTSGETSKYLNNNSYQVSLPIGADIKVAGNDQLKLYLGATLQPTYVFGGQSYLISSDMQNYVAEENFMQKYNLNASIETFITYKTQSGVTLNAGPQFRYQFFSSYNKLYTYDEKLYNLGVKLGMTKNF